MFNLLPGTLVVAMFAMQTASTPAPSPAAPKNTKTPVRLSGCVSQDRAAPSTFTFAQTGTGTKYRLGGASVAEATSASSWRLSAHRSGGA